MNPPGPIAPSTFQVTHFQWFLKMTSEVPITIRDSPFILSQNTPKGDDWVEEEGLGKMLILITVIFNQDLIMFINPLTIDLHIDLHMLQIK